MKNVTITNKANKIPRVNLADWLSLRINFQCSETTMSLVVICCNPNAIIEIINARADSMFVMFSKNTLSTPLLTINEIEKTESKCPIATIIAIINSFLSMN